MAIDYTLNWSDDSLKPPFILTGGTIDTTRTSLALTGKGSINWGERLQENLLHLLENFAGGAAPSLPTIGQLWFNSSSERLSVYFDNAWHDLTYRNIASATEPTGPQIGDLWFNTADNLLYVYTSTGWVVALGGGGGGDVYWADTKEYNDLANRINAIMGAPNKILPPNHQGYNQNPLPLIPTTQHATAANWSALMTKRKTLAAFEGIVTDPTLAAEQAVVDFIYKSSVIRSMYQISKDYETVVSNTTKLENNQHNVVAGRYDILNLTPAAYVGSMHMGLIGTYRMTFPSELEMLGMFNSGSALTISSTMSTTTSAQDLTYWQTFINSLGTFKLTADALKRTVGGTETTVSTKGANYYIANVGIVDTNIVSLTQPGTLSHFTTGFAISISYVGSRTFEFTVKYVVIPDTGTTSTTWSTWSTANVTVTTGFSFTKASSAYLNDPPYGNVTLTGSVVPGTYNTTVTPVITKTASILINVITSDNILTASELTGNVTITGSVTSIAKPGDPVKLVVGNNTYNGTVNSLMKYSIEVPGTVMAANTVVSAQVTATDPDTGNPVYGYASRAYTVSISTVATVSLDNVSTDNIISLSEQSTQTSVGIAGVVGGCVKPGDIVTVTCAGQTYRSAVNAANRFWVSIPMSVIKSATSVAASVTGVDAAGVSHTGSDSQAYVVATSVVNPTGPTGGSSGGGSNPFTTTGPTGGGTPDPNGSWQTSPDGTSYWATSWDDDGTGWTQDEQDANITTYPADSSSTY